MWQQFHDDYIRMDDWLRDQERNVRQPRTENVPIVVAKEEHNNYEVTHTCLHTYILT